MDLVILRAEKFNCTEPALKGRSARAQFPRGSLSVHPVYVWGIDSDVASQCAHRHQASQPPTPGADRELVRIDVRPTPEAMGGASPPPDVRPWPKRSLRQGFADVAARSCRARPTGAHTGAKVNYGAGFAGVPTGELALTVATSHDNERSKLEPPQVPPPTSLARALRR